MMGELIYKKGDLFTSSSPILAHGVNTRGVFASGIAGQIRKLYPKVYDAYLDKFHSDEGWLLGDVQFVEISPNRMIVNMATQNTYGRQGVHVNYNAVHQCFQTLLFFAKDACMDVAIPQVGAGLGGGDWGIIETIICELLGFCDVKVECYILD